ncbi:MAG: CHASE domain-containing protein, partial [Rhodospirillales bacterium]|nr:CHASE domain-containing protein [Rhodospirillales bacterium]
EALLMAMSQEGAKAVPTTLGASRTKGGFELPPGFTVRETGEDVQAGVLMYLPVYRNAAATDNSAARRLALSGFVFSPFHMRDLVHGILGDQRRPVDTRIYDGTATSAETLLFDGWSRHHGVQFKGSASLVVAGRPWTLDIISTPALEASIDRRLAVTVLGGGICISLLLGGLVFNLAQAVRRASDVVKSQRAVEEARAEAEAANHAKTRFLAAASHDLRQPLQSVSLFLHLLDSKLTDPQQQHIAAQVMASLRAAENMLGSLMDTAALEMGAVRPRMEAVSVRIVLDAIVAEGTGDATAKGISFKSRLCSSMIKTDRVLLERMIRNLVHNALRYTRRGGILLACRHRAGQMRIEVWDTGPGIPADKISLIFEEFYQVSPATRTAERNSRRGLGLGLATVAKLAQLLGYSIEVRSKPGRGSCFTIVVPMEE